MPRKQKKYHFIYKTTNVLTGRYYYGMHSTNDLEDGYLGSGKRLRYSIRKYGNENHKRKIIEFVENRKKLKQREREIVNLNEIAKKDCMNIMVGGHGGYHKNNFGGYEGHYRGRVAVNKLLLERYHTDSEYNKYWRKRQKDGLKKYYENGGTNGWVGRKHTEETKKMIGQKNSKHQKDSGNSQYGTCWIYSLELKKSKKIKKEEIGSYLDEGWIKGRKMKF